MHKLSEWFTKNPVAANLLMLLLLVAGYFTSQTIRIEGFPSLPPSSISVTTFYPGANAEQVDRGITTKIENALKGLTGIKKIYSSSSPSVSTVILEKTSDMDIDRFQNEIKTRIDGIFNMPVNAERPVIARNEFNITALILQIYGDVDEATLQNAGRLVKERMLDHPKISRLEMFGKKENEVRIELNEDKLKSYGLSLIEVAQKINSSSLDYRTGELKSENGTILVRSDRKAFEYSEFLDIPIITASNGTRILLKDIAKVVDDFEESDGFARFQSKPTIGIMVYTSQKGHLIEVSEAAREVLEKLRREVPANIKFDIWGETSIYMQNRLNLLATNAWQGLILVFILLAIFLNVRLAFWVAMGIPISVAGALALMGERFLNYSLNDITTFGLILVLGILVDDAVVVGESVYEERGRIKDPIKGTVKGVSRVATATVFGALTTVAAFYPLLMINNDIAKAFASFSVVVIVAVLVSLIESKFILPAHLAAIKDINATPKYKISKAWRAVQDKATAGLNFVIHKLYKPTLRVALENKFSSLAVFLTVAVISLTLIFNGQVKTVFFPQIPGQLITVDMTMQNGSPLKLTMANIEKIEQAAYEINDEIMKEKGTEHKPINKVLLALNGSYSAQIYAELQPEETKVTGTMDIIERWREKAGELEGTEKLQYSGTYETGGGFSVELVAPDRKMLEEATNELKEVLKHIDGVSDITDNFSTGTPQYRLHLKPEAEHLGFTVEQLASQLGNAFGGLEIQRVQRGLDDVRIKVNYERGERKYIEDLLNSRIQNNVGEWIPLSLIADAKLETTEASISRTNGLITTEIKANLDKTIVGAETVFYYAQSFFETDLEDKYPGLELKTGGELEETTELRGGMRGALIVILLLIFTFLAIPLKSYWQPLVIMSVIPFGVTGAIIGHLIFDQPLSLLSFFGMLAVTGVVVNDSLVMMTRFNDMRREGMPIKEALVQAGSSRFRAIMLTTVTTCAGVSPLLFETSEQAQYLIPAAISLAFGEIFATTVTLFVIPTLLSIVYGIINLKEKFKRKLTGTIQVAE